MESMRDTKRIMQREIEKGSTPLSFEKISLNDECYQEIVSREKLTEVLQYLHRIGPYKEIAEKTVINNVYTYMRGNVPDFCRARSRFDRDKLFHQMMKREKKMKPAYQGDCYIETAECFFSLPEDEWENRRMTYKQNEAFGFIMSNKYILGLYKYCREARRDFAWDVMKIRNDCTQVETQLMTMQNVKVLTNCLLLDDVWMDGRLIGAKLYTVFVKE
jgi:hypothetical protein